MFSTADYTPRPQRPPSRPNSPRNPSRAKSKPSLTKQSSSSGWNWPRLVSVEVDIEEKGPKEPHGATVDAKVDQPKGDRKDTGNVADSGPDQTVPSQSVRSGPLKRSDRSERQIHGTPLDLEPHKEPPAIDQDYVDPSQIPLPVSRRSSPAPSNGSLRSGGAVTAVEYPLSEQGNSPVVLVRRVGTGSPSSQKTAQQVDTGTNPEVAQLESSPQEARDPDSHLEQVHRIYSNTTGSRLQTAEEPVKEDQSKVSQADAVPKMTPEKDNAPPKAKAYSSKRSSVSGKDGRPPGSFPGADNVYGEAAGLDDDEHAGTDPAPEFVASERKDTIEPVITKDERGGPHVRFKGDRPSQPAINSRPLSDNHIQTQAMDDQSGRGTEKTSTEPSGSATVHPDSSPTVHPDSSPTVHPDSSPTVPGSATGEQTRRPSRETLRRTRRPSVYIPLSKVAEAKGKIEAAHVQSPQSGVIVNAEERPDPTKTNDDITSYPTRSSPKISNETASDLTSVPVHDPPKVTFLDYSNLSQDSPAAEDVPTTELSTSQENVAETVPVYDMPTHRENRMDEHTDTTPAGEGLSASEMPSQRERLEDEQTNATPPAGTSPTATETGQMDLVGDSLAGDRQSIMTPSSPDTPPHDALSSGQEDHSRDARTPEDVIHRVSVPNDRASLETTSTKRRKSTRRRKKMSLPPPRIFIQSPSSTSEVPEPLPTPAIPMPVSEYKVKSRSGTVISVEHTVHGVSDKLSKKPVKKRSLYLRKARNFAARKVVLNATLGRQMGERTKKRLRKLARGEKLATEQIPAPQNSPDLPPLRKRQSFIRKARNLAARQTVLDATLGRQVAAETKPVLRRMAKGELVVVEEGLSD